MCPSSEAFRLSPDARDLRRRGARVDQVADFQRDVLRNVVDDPVDAEKHSGGVAPLPDLAVYGQFEVKPLHVAAQAPRAG